MVAAICAVPLLCEALSAALDGIAEVESFPAGRRDTDGLLRSLRPEGVVVDTRDAADDAEDYARDTDSPLIHVELSEARLRVLRDGSWKVIRDSSPESIRNVLVGSLYGPRTVSA
jgi:hypothetical protein